MILYSLKKIKGFENGLPVPDESRMQKMAQAEMDRAYAADAMLTKLENEKMELIDRQLAGEDVEKNYNLQSVRSLSTRSLWIRY